MTAPQPPIVQRWALTSAAVTTAAAALVLVAHFASSTSCAVAVPAAAITNTTTTTPTPAPTTVTTAVSRPAAQAGEVKGHGRVDANETGGSVNGAVTDGGEGGAGAAGGGGARGGASGSGVDDETVQKIDVLCTVASSPDRTSPRRQRPAGAPLGHSSRRFRSEAATTASAETSTSSDS